MIVFNFSTIQLFFLIAFSISMGSTCARAEKTNSDVENTAVQTKQAPVNEVKSKTKDHPAPDYAFGAFQRGLYFKAMRLALPLAKLGDPAAQTLIAEMHERGLGVPKNLKQAAFWYKQGTSGNNPTAQLRYALMLIKGKTVSRNIELAEKLMKKSAESENALAQFNWAQFILKKHPGENGAVMAFPYFRKAAEQGVADAQYAIAQIYVNGIKTIKKNPISARKWLARAANAGHDTAQLDLAIWQIDGIGGEKDYQNGFLWMKRAASSGNILAQNRLAHLYINAIGTRPDPAAAATWYILSRRAGMEDPRLADFFAGIEEETQKVAIDAANQFYKR